MSYRERVMSLSFMCLFLRLTLVFDLVLKVSANSEVNALAAFKSSISDPSDVLHSWDTTLATPCTWFHISCNNENSVTRVELGNSNLSGPLAPELGQLQSLQYLELYNNNITGTIPDDFGSLTNLLSLDLYMNKLTGPIPEKLANLKNLSYLRLNDNSLSGNIPARLTTVILRVLDLSNNNLTGNVPFNGSFSAFTPVSFINNPFLHQTKPPPPAVTSQQNPSDKASRPIGVIAGGVAVGAALMFAAPVIAFVYWQRREPPDDFYDVPAEEDPEVHLGQLKRFSLRELLVATDNFSNTGMLGRGGFGKVYKGRLRNGELVAVKRLNPERIQGDDKQFQTEVAMISMAVHKNLLRLHGFCTTSTERLLVYPFMQNGSVESCLKERAESQEPLEWSLRRHIAVGAAKGLDYLHDHCNPKIIHRDIKAANILLDENFEAVVGDFGLAMHMDYKKSHVTTVVRGTIGHIAPEYLSTGRSSEKTDVFGYGVMLLELVTGRRAFDLARLARDEDVYLLEWVRTLLKEKKLETLVDASLQGNYDSDEVEEVIRVALLCTQSDPFERPKMSEVVRMLEGEGFAEKWNQWWNREDTIQQNFNPVNMRNPYWKFDTPSTSTTNNVLPDELSGPR